MYRILFTLCCTSDVSSDICSWQFSHEGWHQHLYTMVSLHLIIFHPFYISLDSHCFTVSLSYKWIHPIISSHSAIFFPIIRVKTENRCLSFPDAQLCFYSIDFHTFACILSDSPIIITFIPVSLSFLYLWRPLHQLSL